MSIDEEDEYVEITEEPPVTTPVASKPKKAAQSPPPATIPLRLVYGTKKKGRKWNKEFPEGGLESLVTAVFSDLKGQAYHLEYADNVWIEDEGDWEMAVEYFESEKPDRLELTVFMNQPPPAAAPPVPTHTRVVPHLVPTPAVEPPAKRQKVQHQPFQAAPVPPGQQQPNPYAAPQRKANPYAAPQQNNPYGAPQQQGTWDTNNPFDGPPKPSRGRGRRGGYQQRGGYQRGGYQQRGRGYQQRGRGYQQRGRGYQQRGRGRGRGGGRAAHDTRMGQMW